jgi:hypothetical protein
MLTVDGVDRMYRQLVKIHAIATTQLVKFAHWCWTDPIDYSAQAGTSRPRPDMNPSTIRLAPSAPTDFSSQAPLW